MVLGRHRPACPRSWAMWFAMCCLLSGSTANALACARVHPHLPEWLRPSEPALFQWGDRSAQAPDEAAPIVTDRPDFTEASSTVGRGVVQIETGYTFVTDDAGPQSTDSHGFPEMLVRCGALADWLELRAGWNWLYEQTGRTSTSGAEDLYLGLKFALTPQDGRLPEMALVPQMTVPTGANAFSADCVLEGLNWLYGWDINDIWATGGSTQFNRALDGVTGREYTEWAQSWTINCSLSDRIGSYCEWFAFFPTGSDTAETEHYLNGGFTVLFTSDVQWDIRLGAGLNDAAEDFFAGTGLSVRLR